MQAKKNAAMPAGKNAAMDLYELLAPAYEILASPERIAREVDAVSGVILGMGARSVLDAGCAAGFHTIELARREFKVTGIDRSPAMIRSARARAAEAGVGALFFEADLKDAHEVQGVPFDAVLCLGNTMASITAGTERSRVLRAFRMALRPQGTLVIQMRDLAVKTQPFPTRALRRGDEEWILLRRMDPDPRGVRFVSVLLHRSRPDMEWETRVSDSVLVPSPRSRWKIDLERAGFNRIRFASDLRGTPRRAGPSGPDLVVMARRA